MPNYTLKSAAQITEAVADPAFNGIATDRKNQLLGAVISIVNELDLAFPGLLARTPSVLEKAFLRALVLYLNAPDTTASPSEGPSGFTAGITTVGSGDSFALEFLPTVGLALPALRTILREETGQLQDWVLNSGTDANDADHQRPNDFNASTNPRVWTRKR